MPDQNIFFCRWSLKTGALFAAHFTSIMSIIVCAVAFAMFFRESGSGDDSKLWAFAAACQAVLHISASRALKRGIKDERRDKFVGWMLMTVIAVVFLLSGVTYVVTLFCTGKFQDATIIITYFVIGGFVVSVIISGFLMYCIWCVWSLWRLYKAGNADSVV